MDETPKQPTVFDADQQHIGDTYAKALLAVGQQDGNVDQLVDELDGFVEAVVGLPKFRAALESPRVPVSAKESMVEKAVGGKVSKQMLNFLKLLGRKGRFDCLTSIRGAAHKLHDEMAGRAQATLTTASPVDDAVRNGVAEKLEKVIGKKVTITSEVDPDIIGGMVVRVGDTVFDASVANHLKKVRSKAIKAASDSIRESLDRFTADAN